MPELQDRLAAALGGRYTIRRELGHGGMAIVFLAHDEKHHRDVAIEVLRPELAAIIGAERFLAEIETTARLVRTDRLVRQLTWMNDSAWVFREGFDDGTTLRDLRSGTTGSDEVYVGSWPDPRGRVAISAAGGTEPAWSPDGSTLYFRGGENALVAARLTFDDASVRVAARERRFAVHEFISSGVDRAYAVAPDGEGFVMIRGSPTRELVVVTGWFTEVREILGMN